MTFELLGIVLAACMAVLGLTALYLVVRYAVRDGVIDANQKMDTDRVRSELRLGPERSPNSRS